jgi:NAD(P)-dependent dehydrogenase (short-subunit alcohol dehydrogenase family)
MGATVVATDNDAESLQRVARHSQEHADNLLLRPITEYDDLQVHALFDDIETLLSRPIDVLINYWQSPSLPSLMGHRTAEDLSRQLTRLAGPIFRFGQAAAEQMRNGTNSSVIVNMLTLDQSENRAGFDNASSIVSGFTLSWAKELLPFNIRVGGIIPSLPHSDEQGQHHSEHWAQRQDELIRSTEYIVSNDYFSGRVVAA